jgi:glycosyltransferase involved in cell wall biosynthesis
VVDKTLSGRVHLVQLVFGGLGGHGAVAINLCRNPSLQEKSLAIISIGNSSPSSDYLKSSKTIGFGLFCFVLKPGILNKMRVAIMLLFQLLKLSPINILCHVPQAMPILFIYRLISPRKANIVYRDNVPAVLKTRYDWLLMQLAHLFCSRVVYLTEEELSEAKDRMPIKLTNYLIIPNAVDTNVFLRKSSRAFSKRSFKLGMASRFEKSKAHLELLNVFMKIRQAVECSSNFELHLAGDGSTLPFVKKRANELGLADKCFFYGHLVDDELVNFFSGLDIYVHLSSAENQSNSVIQALSMSLPVIGFDVRGINNVICNDSGLVFPLDALDEIARKIIYLVNNQDVSRSMGAHARQHAVKNYDVKPFWARYDSILTDKLPA